MTDFDLEYLKSWEGKCCEETDIATLAPARALLATLDRDPDDVKAGDLLPPLFHWLYFLPVSRSMNLGVDGHPQKGDFLPPTPYPRRMFAGGRICFDGDISIGETLQRHSQISQVRHKNGKSGPLLFVDIEHTISGEKGGRITELQNIVYREARALASPDPNPAPPLENAITSTVTPNEVMLFRFSALTFNAHRIHFDRDYASDTEHYPERVVHGPLCALLLSQHAIADAPAAHLKEFGFRSASAFYVNQKISLERARVPADGSVKLRALNPRSMVGMLAEAKFAPNQRAS